MRVKIREAKFPFGDVGAAEEGIVEIVEQGALGLMGAQLDPVVFQA